jgi:hypothetical protein
MIAQAPFGRKESQHYDPKWPCRTLYIDTILEAMFPWLYHVPTIELQSWIKMDQKKRFCSLATQAKAMKIYRPTVDARFMAQIKSTDFFQKFKFHSLFLDQDGVAAGGIEHFKAISKSLNNPCPCACETHCHRHCLFPIDDTWWNLW